MNEELIPRAGDCILCVKIGREKRENRYEMARKYWVVDRKRASKANHVLAIEDGIVVEDYIPDYWYLTDNPRYKGRYEFSGSENANSEYIGKSVRSYYGKSQNPVKYINM